MSWKQLSTDRRNLAARLEREFAAVVRAAERDLSVRLGSELTRLRVDDGGMIRATTGNVRFTRRINQVFDEFRRNQQRGVVAWLVRAVRRMLGLNKSYFAQIRRGGPHSEALEKILISLGYDPRSRRVIQGSWLDDLSRANSVQSTITRRVSSAIIGGLALSSLLGTVKGLLSGAKSLLRRYFSRATQDFFLRIDGQAQNLYAVALDLNHALYAGTIKDNTRPFCKARVQNVYTREEVEKWQNQDWVGKIPGADVKEVCGGYNCRHHLSWITPDIAERLAGQRGINVYS